MQIAIGRTFSILALTGIAAMAACDDDPTGPAEPAMFDFDASLQGWMTDGTDLMDPPVDWSIDQTTDFAHTGDGSVELRLDNLNDAGKIWIVRSFDGVPGQTYQVDLSFALGTADWGDTNLWTIIAGAHSLEPQVADDLTFRDDTGNGAGEDVGYRWVDHRYTSQVTANASGEFYVAIGVWGTYEVERTYFLDDVVIELETL